jgi:hypothetical protein
VSNVSNSSKDKPERKSILREHPLAGTHLGGTADPQTIFGSPTAPAPPAAAAPDTPTRREEEARPLPGGRERQDIPFHVRHKTENIQLDKRLLPAYQQLLRKKGRNKTDALNRIILEACLREGIDVDPSLLDRPFSFEDVAPDHR